MNMKKALKSNLGTFQSLYLLDILCFVLKNSKNFLYIKSLD